MTVSAMAIGSSDAQEGELYRVPMTVLLGELISTLLRKAKFSSNLGEVATKDVIWRLTRRHPPKACSLRPTGTVKSNNEVI